MLFSRLRNLPAAISRQYCTASPASLVSGWVPAAGGNRQLPFRLNRTHTGNLPIYSEVSRKGQRKNTIVRLIDGNMKAAAKIFAEICEQSQVEIRISKIVIKGDHTKKLKEWAINNKF